MPHGWSRAGAYNETKQLEEKENEKREGYPFVLFHAQQPFSWMCVAEGTKHKVWQGIGSEQHCHASVGSSSPITPFL